MRVLFACPVAPWTGEGVQGPSIYNVLAPSGEFWEWKWLTTPARHAQPWTVGVADVSAAQLTLLQAASGVFVVPLANRTSRFSTVTNALRQKATALCTRAGVESPSASDTLDAIFERLMARLRVNPLDTLDLFDQVVGSRTTARLAAKGR